MNSESSVVYRGMKSNSFKLSQGVKQGSIISPYLFNIYTEDLLSEIRRSNHGTYLPGGKDMSVIAFADDLILISPTLSGLQELLDTCVRYGRCHNLKFNTTKTQFLISGTSNLPNKSIILDGKQIEPQDQLKHLGFLWKKSINIVHLHSHLEYRISEMWSVTTSLISGGVRHLHPNQIVDIYKTLVIPKLLYGLELIRFKSCHWDIINRQARCALKALLGVSKHAKNHMHHLYKLSDVKVILYNRKLNLVNQLMVNPNTRDYALSVMVLDRNDRAYSVINEINEICLENGINFLDCLLNKENHRIKFSFSAESEEQVELRYCIENSHNPDLRAKFKSILESAIPR